MPRPPAPSSLIVPQPSRQLPSAAPRQGGSLLEARAENTLHGISDHLIFNYDKNAIMRRVYLKSQFNSAANPLMFVLTRGNSRLDILRQTLESQRGEGGGSTQCRPKLATT